MKKIYWCSNCINASTRNRITFDKNGKCNACQWVEEKKNLNWKKRKSELVKILNKYRSKNNSYDCIVPVSGGKDGSYVAHTLKHVYGMNPLTVTSRPPLTRSIGNENLNNFVKSGYAHLHITADEEIMRSYNRLGLTDIGMPYYGWLISIFTSVIRTAVNFNIPLIFYGEDGEVEYGGSDESKNIPYFDYNYMKRIYLEDGYNKITKKVIKRHKRNFWFSLPEDKYLKSLNLKLLHMSYYENWDPYKNYLIAKKHCGLVERKINNSGTFTNFAQNDQKLYPLHTYLMFLKFGFGRATQDANIDVRRSSMTRDQAINLAKLYDNEYPNLYLNDYLKYYDMNKKKFNQILDKWANRNLLKKIKNKWVTKFDIK